MAGLWARDSAEEVEGRGLKGRRAGGGLQREVEGWSAGKAMLIAKMRT